MQQTNFPFVAIVHDDASTDETAACCAGSVIIPIQSAESLNAGVAAGILMWEMRRC